MEPEQEPEGLDSAFMVLMTLIYDLIHFYAPFLRKHP